MGSAGLPSASSPTAVLSISGSPGETAPTYPATAVKNRPSATVRARTGSQSGVVPTTFVVQLVLPLTSDV